MESREKDAPLQSVQNANISPRETAESAAEITHLCRRCGRKLRSAEAKSRGYGYVCYKKHLKEKGKKKLF